MNLTTRQFRVLYRDFLFGIVDRELLSTYATGDASQLLLQLVALLVFFSACCSLPALAVGGAAPLEARQAFAWSIEHFLIATTMLATGLFAVLSWDTMFPGQQDVFVLGPLPIRAHTILLAKVAASATALSVVVVALHVVSGVVWPLALQASLPEPRGLSGWVRLFIAYWLTMITAGALMLSLTATAQGIAASLLPRRLFLRLSSWLQLSAFALIVGVYLLQPMGVRAAQPDGMLSWSPSHWFLGMFQALIGSPAFAPLASRAWAGLACSVAGMTAVYALSYRRTLRQIAEEPQISPSPVRVRWLPAFGDTLQTSVVQFSIRTLARSVQHRIILAFYWGIGLALIAVLLKSPRGRQLGDLSDTRGWYDTSVPLMVSSIVLTGCAVVAARLAFAMPRDLRANWIFRLLSVGEGGRYLTARRCALSLASVIPVWTLSAGMFLCRWPWRPAVGHLVVLGFLNMILVELALGGTRRIPFTCSYLPGRSHANITFGVAVLVLLPATIVAATFERDALDDAVRYAGILSALGLVYIGMRWHTQWSSKMTGGEPEFDDEPEGRTVALNLSDTGVVPRPTGRRSAT